MSAARECSWSAASQVPWLVVSDPKDGRGDATLKFTVTANPAGTTRRGSLVVNTQAVEVTQEAAACRFTLGRTSLEFAAAGGTLDVDVQGPAGCPWGAESQGAWLTFDGAAQGSGAGRVTVRAATNGGAARESSVTIAGTRVVVRQSAAGSPEPPPPPPPTPDCSYTLSTTAASFESAGGDGTVSVQTRADCSWLASSDAVWVSIRSATTGAGNGDIAYRIAPSGDTQPRIAHITVGNAVLTITQNGSAPPPVCTFSVAPQQVSINAGGGSRTVKVTAGASCGWTASSQTSWITITEGATGTGNNSVTFSVAKNTDTSARSGSVVVAGQTVAVQQEAAAPPPPPPPCTYRLNPSSRTADAKGGSDKFQVHTGETCGWTAQSSASWLTVDSRSVSGTGVSEIRYTVDANPDTTDRTATITVAGEVFTVTQSGAAAPPPPPPPPPPACTFVLTPTEAPIDAAGGSGSFHVDTAADCAWTAETRDGWITIGGSPATTGTGDVTFDVQPNTDSIERTGTITVGDQVFTVRQAAGAVQDASVQGDVDRLRGRCPGLEFEVARTSVRTSLLTRFVRVSCGSLKNGNTVNVTGTRGSDDVLNATEVERVGK